MEIRKVQHTADMFYLYLPTKWCKQFKITPNSKVGLFSFADGSLGISPQTVEQKKKHVVFRVHGEDSQTLLKLLVAAYISPATSFKITLDHQIDFTKVLAQKNLLSLELVEIDGNQITCESSVQVNDALSLLTTMLRKIRNMLLVFSKGTHQELIERYEEEIDRSKLLIEKSVITSLANPIDSPYSSLELHFISLISKELERLVDHLITLHNLEKQFVESLSKVLDFLQELLKDKCSSYQKTLDFLDLTHKMQAVEVKDITTYSKRRVVRALNAISEAVIDWSVVKEIEKEGK